MLAPISKLEMWDQIEVMALVLKYFDIMEPCNFMAVTRVLDKYLIYSIRYTFLLTDADRYVRCAL